MSTKHKPRYARLAQLKSAADFLKYARAVDGTFPFDETLESGQTCFHRTFRLKSGNLIGNRFCILPMEGWDGTRDGRPSDLTRRRWKNFAISGAKLLWGCEAVAVTPEGRANPRQLLLSAAHAGDFSRLFEHIQLSHREKFGGADDLLTGLQLTHSGRFCKPNDSRMEPMILYHHPLLDRKFGLADDYPLLSDEYIDRLTEDFIKAAALAGQCGFHFVDIKHCHGYLGHEFLSARSRKGKYGGSFENRTRFLRNVTEGIRAAAPGLEIAVRVSAFDWAPFMKGPDGEGLPAHAAGEDYAYGFGSSPSGVGEDLAETFRFMEMLQRLDIQLVCITAGSPYYNPHIQRPALFPPSDGYLPPEDPLAGVARHIRVTAEIKKSFPDLCIIGSGYSYLQEWLPHVAQSVLKSGGVDIVGLGRMVLSYPDMPDDLLSGRPIRRDKLCRTFSDCTTAPRNGMISGCFPLDDYYKNLPEAERLKEIKLKG